MTRIGVLHDPRWLLATAPGGATFSKLELSLAEISEYWAPDQRWSRNMVQALLESAFWLGEFSVISSITPDELLKRLFKWMRNCERPAIIFITPESAPPPETKELPNGHLAVDLRPRVFVPSEDVDRWSEGSRIHACQILAEKPSLEHYPDWSPGFCAMKLTRDEFFRWIAAGGFPYPTLWKRTNDDATSLNLKPASEPMIEGEVRRVYDSAHKEGKKPPNINEVVEPVQARLRRIHGEWGANQTNCRAFRVQEAPETTW